MYPSDVCPIYAPFFGALGCCCAVSLCVFGAAYGTAKSGTGIIAAGVIRPDRVIPNSIPVIMAGIVAIYGLVVSVMIVNQLSVELHIYKAFMMLGAGLSVGMCGLGAGITIGITGDVGARGSTQQPRLFVGMMMMQIFSEVLAIYGMIIAVLMLSQASNATC